MIMSIALWYFGIGLAWTIGVVAVRAAFDGLDYYPHAVRWVPWTFLLWPISVVRTVYELLAGILEGMKEL